MRLEREISYLVKILLLVFFRILRGMMLMRGKVGCLGLMATTVTKALMDKQPGAVGLFALALYTGSISAVRGFLERQWRLDELREEKLTGKVRA